MARRKRKFNEKDHPRHLEGSSKGGRFREKADAPAAPDWADRISGDIGANRGEDAGDPFGEDGLPKNRSDERDRGFSVESDDDLDDYYEGRLSQRQDDWELFGHYMGENVTTPDGEGRVVGLYHNDDNEEMVTVRDSSGRESEHYPDDIESTETGGEDAYGLAMGRMEEVGMARLSDDELQLLVDNNSRLAGPARDMLDRRASARSQGKGTGPRKYASDAELALLAKAEKGGLSSLSDAELEQLTSDSTLGRKAIQELDQRIWDTTRPMPRQQQRSNRMQQMRDLFASALNQRKGRR